MQRHGNHCCTCLQEKLDIARQLSLLGVDVIEAGFPISSPDDFAAVKEVAIQIGNDVQVCVVLIRCSLSGVGFAAVVI